MTTVVGIDLSLSATGIAVFDNRKVYVTTIRTQPWDDAHGWQRAGRNLRIVRTIRGHTADGVGSTLAVIEARIPPTGGWHSSVDRAELRGALEVDLCRLRIPIAQPAPGTLKKYATGNGGATKAQMVEAARDALGTRCPIENDNEADAFWLMVMAVQHYRLAAGDLFGRVFRPSLDKVVWPPLVTT